MNNISHSFYHVGKVLTIPFNIHILKNIFFPKYLKINKNTKFKCISKKICIKHKYFRFIVFFLIEPSRNVGDCLSIFTVKINLDQISL